MASRSATLVGRDLVRAVYPGPVQPTPGGKKPQTCPCPTIVHVRPLSMSDHCPCPTIVHARPLSMPDHCPCSTIVHVRPIVYASNRKPRRSDCASFSQNGNSLFCPPDGEIMPRGGRMTPEPVPSALEKKKLFFPRGEIICVRAGLPKKSVG